MFKNLCPFFFSLFFSCIAISNAAEPVTSNCNWKPTDSKVFAELVQDKSPSLCTASRPNDCDELLVAEKGRTHIYSLPNASCKSEFFLVFRDQVSAVDFYPDRSGNYTDFVKIIYSSKLLNKEISGWVEMKRFCRLNANNHCPANDLKPK
jgi:hypothetical protein